MAERRVLKTWWQIDVRAFVSYEWARGASASDIHRSLQSVYEDDVMSRQSFGRWYSMFSEGRQSVEDENRSGRPSTSTTAANADRAQEMNGVNEQARSCVCYRIHTEYWTCSNPSHDPRFDGLSEGVGKMGAEGPHI
ncbi:hypothetical protein AVEN_75478-1 [Araneus ventricosus]|uniref:Mos1 transposase HTH domain-containing protein n=1 Tax=Araneus ventricosus TaxID=182803 RepID=A0A4Y2DQZ6_ARAVE|nr:hypothetical protein AVEN_75478-1 [Araneus ventricosus]